uniref:Uncharacterized protein n=1 Tax=Anguilla anguilla TaxID=7936 RepID=A0A0E9PH27_ANGAN
MGISKSELVAMLEVGLLQLGYLKCGCGIWNCGWH